VEPPGSGRVARVSKKGAATGKAFHGLAKGDP